MKKLLLGSIVLTTFSIAIIIFQMSCQKTAEAQTSTTTGLTQLNLILFSKHPNSGSGNELWTANLDGTNQKKIPITLPTGQEVQEAKLTPDGKKVVFVASYVSGSVANKGAYIYTCSLDGSNLVKILDNPTLNFEVYLAGTY